MLRLAPPGYLRFVQSNMLEATFGGGEANVAVTLANFGVDAGYVTKLPDNPMGRAAVNELRRYGVCTDKIIFGGERLGIYYLEKGASQRASLVVYDRKHSAISEAAETDFDWQNIFAGAEWFHFTGITPAISEKAAALTLNACRAAKNMGLAVSCDLNYRKNLWSKDEARKTMTSLMEYVDLLIANEEDSESVFGIKAAGADVAGGKISHDGYKEVAEILTKKFNFKNVAITLRESISASDNNWTGMLCDGGEFYFSKTYPVHIVDRVGGGDAFGGGLIYAMMNGYAKQDAIEFAVAASCLKHSIEGDFNHVSLGEVTSLMRGGGSGRVQR